MEVPFILLMDTFNIERHIYGFTTLRFELADVFGSDYATKNFFGWLLDFDKSIFWIITIICFIIFKKSILQFNDDKNKIKSFINQYSHWIFLAGLFGAAIILVHYSWLSSSGHLKSFQDKGLIDSFWHIIKLDTPLLGWFSLFLYRLTYFLLNPLLYFILFSVFFTSILIVFKILNNQKLHKYSNNELKILKRSLLLIGFPTLGLLLFHDILVKVFGLSNYNPNEGARRIILYILYFGFSLSIALVLFKIDWNNKIVSKSINIRKNNIILYSTYISMIIYPCCRFLTHTDKDAILNKSIYDSAYIFLGDYNYLPESNTVYCSLIKEIQFNTCNKIPPKLIPETLECKKTGMQAFLLSTITLLRLGMDSNEISKILMNKNYNINQFLDKKYKENNKKYYPMFYKNQEGKDRLISITNNVITNFRLAYSHINWKCNYTDEERINQIIAFLTEFVEIESYID